ncbi:hypothetical protein G3T36_15850 [Diaminobutyricibacter tongyongensis]|uniref:Uncharacterized protein n=1 Tax=Leifsonia tongyongensis TaxID=1268043 RepID=A0A6L9Y102_9MICO|nr:hypothetical protein [Diaminobutyricibacter tongyongensis]NEN07333.1 hypothetical protein [Diaminobutyricibacter tongyongensis]
MPILSASELALLPLCARGRVFVEVDSPEDFAPDAVSAPAAFRLRASH